ncbi:hypothetical protein EYZ11_009521 [Aspergillus tanneri]|uniref:Uncharacterized protein n=1 Tax=Aspergillus tanneri TaxID=1220188 RepID=A0A4S3J7P4_9EURO|nr:hypothetical protein EYZ11_009521 [Aspergillus tanneri]
MSQRCEVCPRHRDPEMIALFTPSVVMVPTPSSA